MKNLNKWIYLAVVTAALIAAAASFYFREQKGFKDSRIDQIFKMRDLNNNPLKISSTDFIIVNFWASWCPPCVEETPSLIRFTEKYKKNFTLYALSQDSTKQDIEAFIKTFPSLKSPAVTVIHDDSQSIARFYLVNKLPETFIYSVKQNRYMQFSGATDWERPEVIEAIQKYFQVSPN